jgi:microcompartment protein CcmL/EutN
VSALHTHWGGFTCIAAGQLRALVLVEGARRARVTVTVRGQILDVQASDCAAAGTTGHSALDDAVIALVLEHLTLARDANAYAEAERLQTRALPRRRARR